MKILIFSTAYLPFIGGAEVAVKEITDRLGDFEFDMITARLNGKLPKFERVGNINIHRIGIGAPMFDKYLLAFFGQRFARKLHKKNNYDVIWSIMASYAGFAAASFKKIYPTTPFLLTLQEGDDLNYINKRVGFLKSKFKQIFSSADYIQCISNFLADWAKNMGAKCEVEVVPNGVSLDKLKSENEEVKTEIHNLKNKLGIKESEKVIITVSRLVPKNGVGDLIEAVSKLQIPNYKLLILGSGPLEESLKSKTESLKLGNRVNFLGEIPNKKVPEYLAISDVFVRPSLSEGLGNAFLEAMAAGVPVIGTEVGGIPDFLVNRETGLFCEASNSNDIAEKIKLLLTDNDLRNKLIVNGRKLVEEKYNWNEIAERMENIFNKLE
ncbi:MAG: glycosyltransferase family 4 protein [Candidatus Portnoybacteria bacterium]|nr:glycosyltransferase family 4 protein [Candidatus Portnoybacteria bacterium]